MQHLLEVDAALVEQTEEIRVRSKRLLRDVLLDANPFKVCQVLRSFVTRVDANRQGGMSHYTFPLADRMRLLWSTPLEGIEPPTQHLGRARSIR